MTDADKELERRAAAIDEPWIFDGVRIATPFKVGFKPAFIRGQYMAAADPSAVLSLFRYLRELETQVADTSNKELERLALLDRVRELEKERAGLRAMIDRLAADCIRLEKRVPEGGGRTTGGGRD